MDGKTISIKTSTYAHDPHLREFLNAKYWCDYYFLIGLDLFRKHGKVFGWATLSELKSSKLFDYGYGPRYSISHKDLHKYEPKAVST